MERSLEDNILTLVGPIATPGLWATQGITSGITKSGRERVLIEFYQDLDDCVIDGIHRDAARSNLVVIGIKGELHDHLLLMRYLSLPEGADPGLDADLHTLLSVVDSFRPLMIANAVERHLALRQEADNRFQTLMEESGQGIFYREMQTFALRLKGWDLDDLEDRRRAITWLKPFEMLAEEVGLDDPAFVSLWAALKQAEQGEAAEFKALMNELIEEFTEGIDGQDDAQVPPDDNALEPPAADVDQDLEDEKN